MNPPIYQFREIVGKSFTAGTKAVDDIWSIASQNGVKTIVLCRVMPHNFRRLPGWLARFCAWLMCEIQYRVASVRISSGSVLLMQHPIRDQHSFVKDAHGRAFLRRLRTKKKVKVVTLIHDIEELRPQCVLKSQKGAVGIDTVMKFSDVLIVHNHRMAEWFEAHGVAGEHLVELEIFDYLSPCEPVNTIQSDGMNVVFYAGSLCFPERRFLSGLKNIPQVKWVLYGPNYRKEECEAVNVQYEGICSAEELPRRLTHGFGLVWDGETVNGCTGASGEYLLNINPHKMSLFLSAGLPVIVWKPSYSAEIVEKYHVGIAVDSLEELPGLFEKMSADEYCSMSRNARMIGSQLRVGHFFKAALQKAHGLTARSRQLHETEMSNGLANDPSKNANLRGVQSKTGGR